MEEGEKKKELRLYQVIEKSRAVYCHSTVGLDLDT